MILNNLILLFSVWLLVDCGRTGETTNWHKQSCLNQIQLWIMEELHVLASAVITLVFLQVNFFMYNTIKPKRKQFLVILIQYGLKCKY